MTGTTAHDETEDTIVAEMARRAAADRLRNSTIRRFAPGGSVESNPQFLETRDAVEGMEGGDAPTSRGLSFDHLIPKTEGTAPAGELSFDHLVPQKDKGEFKGLLRGAGEGLLNAPSEAIALTKERALDVVANLDPFSEERLKNRAKGISGDIDNWLKTGKGLLGVLGLPFAPIEGAVRSAVGTPMAELTHTVGTYINPEVAAKDDRGKMVQRAKEDVGTALSAVAARRAPATPVPTPAAPKPDMLGVTLSEGQRTGELPLIRNEQAALRGQKGPAAEARAREFAEQQEREVSGAAGNISQQILGSANRFDTPGDAAAAINAEISSQAARARQVRDAAERGAAADEVALRRMVDDQGNVLGDVIAEGRPAIGATRESGEVTGQAVRETAARDRADYQRRYDEAFGLEGQFHAGTFEGIGNRIQGRLTLGDNPVIIDDVTTPVASRAIRDLDNISHLRIQNRADPFGEPNPENIVAVDLRGVDQARKRLVAFYRAARSSNNAADMRATGRLIDEFDDQIERSISNGLFSGDPRALDALREARAAYSRYQRQYRPQHAGDDVGNAMRRIIDRNATPEEIANMVIGAGRIGNAGLPVRIADRLEAILGRDSDAWSAIRQGIWRRASQVRNSAGEVDPARSATGIMDLAESSLGRRVFGPDELRAMRTYAQDIRGLEDAAQALPSVRRAEQARTVYEDVFMGEGIGGAQQTTFRRIAEGVATPEETAQAVFNAIGSGNPGNVARMIRSIERLTGPQSESMSAIRQGVWQKLVEPVGTADAPGAQRMHTALNQFLNGRGRTIAAQLYSPAELAMMREFSDLQRHLIVPPTGANRSETSTFMAPMLRKLGSKVGMALGALVGHTVAPGLPWGVSEAVGAGVAKVIGKAGDRLDARAIAKQMPLVSERLQQWQRAVARANKANNPLSSRQVALATSNLARSLEPLGVKLGSLLPSAYGVKADQNEGGTPGGGEQQPNENEAGQLHAPNPSLERTAPVARASGGRVNAANIEHEPTEAQKKAGNYAKDHVCVHGLDIAIENAKGKFRSGVDRGGKPWSVKMPAHYGYIKRTEGRDGDHVDVYLGPALKSERVFVIDQLDADTRRFDEHKVLIGFLSRGDALRTYKAAFSDGKAAARLGHVEEMPVGEFKKWLTEDDTTKPVGARKDKLSHKAVGYVAKSSIPKKACANCSMFVAEGGPACTLVASPISPDGWCRRYARKDN